MNAFLSTAILLAGLTQASSGTTIQVGELQASGPSAGWVMAQAAPPQAGVTGTGVLTGDNMLGWPLSVSHGYTRDDVLVVPTSDLPVESRADLTQDLNVMCRIFGKSVPFTSSGRAPVRPAGTDDAFYGLVLGPMTRGAQALYLDGYGALFFLHVDYPLVPTDPQEPAQAKTPESTDDVWARTLREMSGQADEEQHNAPNAPTYDPRRVDELTRALIKTLVHCSNIRMRRPEDMVTLVVGDLEDSRRPNFRVLPATRYGRTAAAPAAPTGNRPATASLLILRATKADVDAFAKDQLTLDQFTKKVQVLFSPSVSDATAPAATGPTQVGTRK